MIKEAITAVVAVACFILLIPLFILYFIRLFGYMTCAQLLSIVPGFLGIMLRRVWYKCTLEHCGTGLVVDFLGAIRTPKTRVGDHVYIGVNSFIGLADIGSDTMISASVLVLSGGAQHGTKQVDRPMRLQEGIVKRIVIGTDCWIGAHVTILADVAPHSVVGAASLVNKTFKPYDIIAGVPVQKIRSRKSTR